ncbi:MAG TPA: hypothetical protein VGR50_04470, partial [Terriglobales bacterium]|nr:hypothetical protein [Terriglobales bacterium]
SSAAWLFWCIPIAVILGADFWSSGRDWLWAGAFAVMGIGCLVNAGRCHRLHCYFTAPLFLGAGGYALAAQYHLVRLAPGLFLVVVFALTCAFQCAERPFGRYWKRQA